MKLLAKTACRHLHLCRQDSLENTLTQFLILSGNLYSHHLSGVSIQWMDMFAAITCIGRP